MKTYEDVIELDTWEVKEFLLKNALTKGTPLEKVILFAADLPELKRHLKKNSEDRKLVFNYLKQEATYCMTADEVEKILVMMTQLIPFNDSDYTSFRRKFIAGLLREMGFYFTKEEYQLLRHLYAYNETQREHMIDMYDCDDEVQKGYLCEIYLIEQNYKKAYTYLKDCEYSEKLRKYDHALKYYSYIKYRKYALKKPIFALDELNSSLWTKKQLKF